MHTLEVMINCLALSILRATLANVLATGVSMRKTSYTF